MNDIFLSYAREDLAKAELLAAVLEAQGWSVFWDRSSILAGQDFDEVIEMAIAAAKCMIVLWSSASKKSHYVRDEARLGRDNNILVPILIEAISAPMGFGSLHCENFSAWNGDLKGNEFNQLRRAVTRLLGVKPASEIAAPNLHALATVKTASKPQTAFIEPEMVDIPAGSFQMGCARYNNEKPIRLVTLNRFEIGRYPVTFAEYDHYAETLGKAKPDDGGWGRTTRPVINVSWDDAVAYAQWLSSVTGKPFRLLSEAEWEYAARAGSSGEYYWGDQGKMEEFVWFKKNSVGKTQTVGQKRPNAFGLYDMSGNVWEWVQDAWHKNYDNAPTDGSAWQADKNDMPTLRVSRGGSWRNSPVYLRSAYRTKDASSYRYNGIGFRLARDLNN